MNNKFSIGVVVAIVLQVSAFVWWTAQQAQTISQLNQQVSELTSRMAVEDDVNMKRDIAEIVDRMREHEEWITENYQDIEDLIYFATFTENRWADSYATDPSYERKFGTKAPVK
jgi:enoyl-[acyl-carrier-protein] reductase (NADH)